MPTYVIKRPQLLTHNERLFHSMNEFSSKGFKHTDETRKHFEDAFELSDSELTEEQNKIFKKSVEKFELALLNRYLQNLNLSKAQKLDIETIFRDSVKQYGFSHAKEKALEFARKLFK